MGALKWVFRIGAVAGAAALVNKWLRTREEPTEEIFTSAELTERRSEPDPEALQNAENGGRVGLDLDRLKGLPSAEYKPLVEYLTYIQTQRGEERSLVFVRQRDIDSLADLTGESRENLLEEFKQLGVLLSMN